jgi:ABC-type uncharacterized transport system substrate-binding protein
MVAQAQQGTVPLIGVLHSQSPAPYEPMLAALRQGLSEAGFREPRDILIEQRWARGQLTQLPDLAADLVRLRVAVIVASGGTLPAFAAKAATSTIPIVLAFGSDPVEAGLIASLNRTGVQNRLTYRSSFRPNLNSSSISRPLKRSASPSRKRCWPPLTRSFNEQAGGHCGAQ